MNLLELLPPLIYLSLGESRIVACHFPILSWRNMHHGSWMLHGHSHGRLDNTGAGKRLDVGVDAAGCCVPLSLEQIQALMEVQEFKDRPERTLISN